jgi:exonuclease III
MFAMDNLSSLNIVSYNCRGYNERKGSYIRSLLRASETAILFLQEHWLSVNQLQLLSDLDPHYFAIGVSGFANSDILSGRPYGGCAILWSAGIDVRVSSLSSNSNRICAARMENDEFKLLLINIYMPCECGDESTGDFADQLSFIEHLIDSNADCHVILGGDCNVDFSRDTVNTELLNSFCDHMGLDSVVRHSACDIDYTYNFNMERFSILDHFLLSGILFSEAVVNAYVIHDIDNTSDHEPVVLQLSLQARCLQFTDKIHVPQVSWVRATEANVLEYKTDLGRRLRSICSPVDALLCRDLRCRHAPHFQAINAYANELTEACIAAAEATLPVTCDRRFNGCMPGWSEHVKPTRERSLFWHRMWLDCDRPKHGPVADAMRRTRAAYHYKIRQVKKSEESIIRERVADAFLSNSGRNFWREIKLIKRNKAGVSSSMDGLTSANEIAQLFAAKYRDLYTSVSYDKFEMQSIVDALNVSVASTPQAADCVIDLNAVKTAASRLKSGKKEGSTGFTSDHIVHAGDDFLTHISCLFTSIIVHGSVTDSFLSSTIVPIPKNRNANLSDSSNYRGIALSSMFGKLLDYIILERYHDKLSSCDLQFGFKAKSSTGLCSMVLKESIAYYLQHQSSVFCTFLDATKAFDRLNYCKLFKLLVERDIPAHIVRVLVNLYTNNLVRVSWGGVTSECFLAANGVKQGAVLSPVLFCVYIDNMLKLLAKAGIGCHIGPIFVGALAYADDIVILAPTATAMRRLLAICDEYAREYNISFNASKSKYLVAVPSCRRLLSEHINDCAFVIGNRVIERVDSFVHLGHVISSKLDDDGDIQRQCSDFIRQTNNVICYFNKLDSFVRNSLFKSYCSSFYGCELWSLSNDSIEDLCTAWRKGARAIWRLPPQSHSYLLPLVCQCLPLYDEICRRFLNFARACVFHDSTLVRAVALHATHSAGTSSPFGQNLRICSQRFECSVERLLSCDTNNLVHRFVDNLIDINERRAARFLTELLLLREGRLQLGLIDEGGSLSRNELNEIVAHVCTAQPV